MSSIEKIQIKGTEIAAKAINSNNGTLATNQKVELSNASGAETVNLEIKLDNTSGASNDAGVDLSKLVKADGSGDVTLKVTGVDSKDTITLSKEKVSAAKTDKGFVETVVLDAKATEVTVKNVFANDKLEIKDLASFSGPITALDLSASLTDKNVYFATSLNTSGIQAKLSEGQQVAVAVNANNSSTIYLVGKAGVAQKIATVDTIINGTDEFSAGTITFKDGDTPVVTAKELTYGGGTATALKLSDLSYNGTTFASGDTLDVITISGGLTITSGGNTVNAYMKDAGGVVTKGDQATGTVTAFIGDKAVSPVNDSFALTNATHATALETLDAIKVNTTGMITAEQTLLSALKTAGKTIDATASGVVGKFTISGDISVQYATNTGLKVDANDEITASVAKGSSPFDVTLSSAKETLILKNTDDGTNIATIKGFATGADKANIVAQVSAASASGDFITPVASTTDLAKGKIYWTTSDISTASQAFALFKNSNTYATEGKDLFVSVSGGNTNVYLLITDSTAGAGAGDTIKLLAKFDSELAQDDFVLVNA